MWPRRGDCARWKMRIAGLKERVADLSLGNEALKAGYSKKRMERVSPCSRYSASAGSLPNFALDCC